MTTLKDVVTLATKLAEAVVEDISEHGGLTSTETLTIADHLRLAISRWQAAMGEKPFRPTNQQQISILETEIAALKAEHDIIRQNQINVEHRWLKAEQALEALNRRYEMQVNFNEKQANAICEYIERIAAAEQALEAAAAERDALKAQGQTPEVLRLYERIKRLEDAKRREVVTLDELILQLESLRGTHDQTMRCGVIDAVYGPSPDANGVTATERFLEDMIAQAKESRRQAVVELLDQE